MKKSHKRIISSISSLIGLLVGFKLMDFLRSDRCLDLGGSITNWGACDFGDARAEVIPLGFSNDCKHCYLHCSKLFYKASF